MNNDIGGLLFNSSENGSMKEQSLITPVHKGSEMMNFEETDLFIVNEHTSEHYE